MKFALVLICCTIMVAKSSAAPEKCVEGHSYEVDCNTCTCSPTGIYVCTRRQCYEGPQYPDTVTQAIQPARKRRDEAAVTGCDKGPSYNDGCNSCTCTKSGTYACTRRLCYEGPGFPDTATQAIQAAKQKREIDAGGAKSDDARAMNQNFLRFDAERCTPGEVKNEVCNRCKCTKLGKGWMCTQKACPQKVE